jgi:hypothetical protein
MRFYMVNFTGGFTDSECRWFTSRVEAQKFFRKMEKDEDCQMVFDVVEYDIPTRKKELLDWLNQYGNQSLGFN